MSDDTGTPARIWVEELPPLEPHPKVVITGFDMVVLAHGRSPGLITNFDTTPGPPVPWRRQLWWRIRGLWPLYRCRHDR